MKLFLDDFRKPPDEDEGWYIVRSYQQFVDFIKRNGVPELISFDHDLGACEECTEKGLHVGDMKTPETTFMNWCPHAKTGFDCALFLIENHLLIKSFRCHSANPIGRKKILELLSDWKKGIAPAKLNFED
jgi:hypothetical protein